MAKKKQMQMQEPDDYFDMMSFDEEYEHSAMVDMMDGMIAASNTQTMMAIELTKLIVANSTEKNMEAHVFSVFEKAVKVVGKNYALKNLIDQFEQ